MSDLSLYFGDFPVSISGAMCWGVPSMVDVKVLLELSAWLSPKSPSARLKSSLTNTLAALISRCTMLLRWRYSRQETICTTASHRQ